MEVQDSGSNLAMAKPLGLNPLWLSVAPDRGDLTLPFPSWLFFPRHCSLLSALAPFLPDLLLMEAPCSVPRSLSLLSLDGFIQSHGFKSSTKSSICVSSSDLSPEFHPHRLEGLLDIPT